LKIDSEKNAFIIGNKNRYPFEISVFSNELLCMKAESDVEGVLSFAVQNLIINSEVKSVNFTNFWVKYIDPKCKLLLSSD
jgi:hypothetical protein